MDDQTLIGNGRRVMARLRAEYEQSIETLKPLKAQLAWTDGLIDQMAYRLYGLSLGRRH